MISIVLSVFALLALNPHQANAGGDTCFVPPNDPSDCSLADAARTQMSVAAAKVRRGAALAEGVPANADVECFLAAANYVSRCDGQSCSSIPLTVEKPLSAGWKETHSLFFRGAPGSCTYVAERSTDSTSFVSPAGTDVLDTLVQSKTATAHRMYSLSRKPECMAANGSKTDRDMTVSQAGVLITDWDDDGTVSHHWARRAEVSPHGEPRWDVVDAETLRLTWPNQAYIKIDSHGVPKDSNFLPSSAWDPSLCKTDTDGVHVYPRLEVLKHQHFARVQHGFVKQ